LNIDQINGLCSTLPFYVVQGSISHIHAHIPWRKLLADRCKIEVSGLLLVLVPIVHLPSPVTQSVVLSASSLLDHLQSSLHSYDPTQLKHNVLLQQQLTSALQHSAANKQQRRR